jgi:hypothetical protein
MCVGDVEVDLNTTWVVSLYEGGRGGKYPHNLSGQFVCRETTQLEESACVEGEVEVNLHTNWVVNFTFLPLYHSGNSIPFPLDKRLDGPRRLYTHDMVNTQL